MTTDVGIGILRAAFVAASLVWASPAVAQHEHGASGEALGKVEFRTSCSPAVRDAFNRSVALLHSFEFRFAIEAFTAVLQKEPSCAVAHWGIVLSQWSNPFGGVRPPQVIERGQEALARARASTDGKMDARERAYFDAAALLFDGAPKAPQRDRTLAYERAMEHVYRTYPDGIARLPRSTRLR